MEVPWTLLRGVRVRVKHGKLWEKLTLPTVVTQGHQYLKVTLLLGTL